MTNIGYKQTWIDTGKECPQSKIGKEFTGINYYK